MTTKKITEELFLSKAISTHGKRYLYESINYCGYKTKVEVTCRLHGRFSVTPKSHCYQGTGCPDCGKITSIRKSGKPYLGLGVSTKYRSGRGSFKSFENRIKKLVPFLEKELGRIHNKMYTYKFPKNIQNIEKDRITVFCADHGKFTQIVKNHLKGQGCKECGKKKAAKSRITSYTDFTEQAQKTHNNFYIYDEKTYSSVTQKTLITCPYHGSFEQLAISHIRGVGCPSCGRLKQGSSPRMFKDVPTLFYVIRLIDGNYKLGITTKSSVDERYVKGIDKKAIKEVLFLYTFLDGFEARTFELDVISKLKPFGFKGKSIMTVKTTEMFTINPTDIIQQLLDCTDRIKICR